MTLFHKKQDDYDVDWRDLDALPKEILSKKELDALQNEVLHELKTLQEDVINQSGEKSIAQPQTLYYYHKYIDAKFSKNDFDINTYFAKKQNTIDYKYAEGIGDIKAELIEYSKLFDEAQELAQRLYHKVQKLDPKINIDSNLTSINNNMLNLSTQINELPEEINWSSLKE